MRQPGRPPDLSSTDFRIGDFVVRPSLKVVQALDDSGDVMDEERRLPDKAMAVLVYLAGRAFDVCLREEILDAVWGEDRESTDRVLDNAIRDIRRVLEDDARAQTSSRRFPIRDTSD